MDQYIGKLLDNRYEILEVIGTGGMAIVYKARCRLLNRFVAIKILKDEFARDDEFRKRFYNESQAVAKLSHNNIVSIYDVSHTEGVEYIVMELIEGITLKEYLQKKGKLSWQEALYFAQQIARALNHAHSRGIIHQDIKPHNIVLLRDGTAKVTDFGIAKFAANQETKVIQEAIGSVHYISPEQAKGSAIDFRTDIYSLGVLMYEMLTGQLPFEGDSALSIVMQHINAVPLMPSALSSDIPEAMDQIVMHAMCPVVSKRYSSAQELYGDLEKLKNDPNWNFNYKNNSGRSEQENLEATRQIKYNPDEVEYLRQHKGTDNFDRSERKHKKRSLMGAILHKVRSSPVALAVITVVAIFIGAVYFSISLIFSGNSNKGEMIEVPNFMGKNYEDEIAKNEEYSENFEIEIATELVDDPNAEEGEVLKQDPVAGEMTEKGGKIILTISKLPIEEEKELIVPHLAGLKLQEAVAELLRAGIDYEKKEENSEDVETGIVIRTTPDEGQTIKEDEKVTLIISSGKKLETVKMPNLVGMTEDAAKASLETLKLKLGTVTPKESDQKAGNVLSQTIPKDIEIATGTVVDIEVAIPKNQENEDTEENDTNANDSEPVNGSKGTDNNPKIKSLSPIVLPQDRDTARVVVRVDGNIVYDQTHNTSEKSVKVSLKGKGSQLAVIEVEGMPPSEELIIFD